MTRSLKHTQEMMEKNEKAMAARAASAPAFTPGLGGVLCHWLARKQKLTNHRKAQKPGEKQSPSVTCFARRVKLVSEHYK